MATQATRVRAPYTPDKTMPCINSCHCAAAHLYVPQRNPTASLVQRWRSGMVSFSSTPPSRVRSKRHVLCSGAPAHLAASHGQMALDSTEREAGGQDVVLAGRDQGSMEERKRLSLLQLGCIATDFLSQVLFQSSAVSPVEGKSDTRNVVRIKNVCTTAAARSVVGRKKTCRRGSGGCCARYDFCRQAILDVTSGVSWYTRTAHDIITEPRY